MNWLLSWLRGHIYPISLILAILLVTLGTLTNGFAGLRRGMTSAGRQVEDWQKSLRLTGASLMGQVWCVTTFTDEHGQLDYGHYPGMDAEEVLTFHNGPIWLLRDKDQQQETTCFRSWYAAAEAGNITLETPDSATEEAYKNAVLAFYLDKGRLDPTPMVASAAADTAGEGTPEAGAASGEVWCFSEIKTVNNLVVTVPHPPGGRTSIETVLDRLANRSEFENYTIRASICFQSWPAAADYITGGEVVLADSATERDYHAAIKEWMAGKR